MSGKKHPLIVIVGFMGVGKTVVATALARKLACAMIDLDRFIEAREGRSPQTIIDEEGEPRFREIESRALAIALDRDTRVLALGGGTWTIPANRAFLNQHDAFTVWLDAPFGLCWRRIEDELRSRPLARDHESARGLYEERRAVYAQADLRVEVSEGKSADAIATEIIESLPPGARREFS